VIQIDGSEHAWFENRAPQCTLLAYADDAAGRLMIAFKLASCMFRILKQPARDISY
jgi:hypothetical protein